MAEIKRLRKGNHDHNSRGPRQLPGLADFDGQFRPPSRGRWLPVRFCPSSAIRITFRAVRRHGQRTDDDTGPFIVEIARRAVGGFARSWRTCRGRQETGHRATGRRRRSSAGRRGQLIWDGKYDDAGRRVAPLRVALPFQTVETVNKSAQDRQRSLQYGPGFGEEEWRNRLIWGDKKYVLPSLFAEFAGKVNLIYIDPPFDTGADFSFTA